MSDPSPTEYVWGVMQRYLRRHPHQPQTAQELTDALVQGQSLTHESIHCLVEACIDDGETLLMGGEVIPDIE